MKLFQYWDTGDPPDEVAGWIEGFRAMNPEMQHRLYDRDSASWFIGKHIGERERRAFDLIAVPSMQSDYFRYCAVWAKGGAYVDADFQPLAPLAGLLDQAPRSMMLVWDGHMVAGLMMSRAPRDAFLRACLDLATNCVEDRWGKNAYMAAGPGVINALRLLADPASRPFVERGFDNVFGRTWGFPELLERAKREIAITDEIVEALKAMTLRHVFQTPTWIGTQPPAYKGSGRHWLRWQGSIYEPAASTCRLMSAPVR